MIVINLFGAPGSGKSTGAAYIFSKLKIAGINAELVTEFAKDKVWEENNMALKNQAYVFGEQYYRLSRLRDKVDVVITDSPILLSILYNQTAELGEAFNEVVKQVSASFNSINILLKRVKPYNPSGRLQSEAESDAIHDDIESLLNITNVGYATIDGSIDGYDMVVNTVLQSEWKEDTYENYIDFR